MLMKLKHEHDHPTWLVVVEHPGGGERTFGITVIHRDRADPNACWTEDDEERLAGNCRVAGGDDWRTSRLDLLDDLADSLHVWANSTCDIFFMITAGHKDDDDVMTYAVIHAVQDHLDELKQKRSAEHEARALRGRQYRAATRVLSREQNSRG
jgi:hypothetical protein